MMLAKTLLIAALGASVANAHMKMVQPVPYGKDSLNNSPLDGEGGDFPCKLRGDTYTVSTENMMEVGVTQTLQLMGQATHGGGSCQISLTEDRAPSKSTTWKVIQSYQGGCPANVTGNMGGDASALDPTTFSFKIPDDIAAGKYTLAWTWFNRVGNREMYMNCAPVTVTTSSSKRDVPVVEKRTANYPPMFVANINGCTTTEGVDIRFPQPGPNVQTLEDDANLAAEGDAACSGTPTFAGDGDTSSGSSSSGSGTSGSDSGSSSSTAAGSASTETSSQAAAAVPISTSSPAETSAPSVPQPAASTVAPASPSSSSSSSSGSSGALTGSCSPEGSWNCIAGTSFQRCANGQWSASQQMASGTQCTAGQSSDLSISAIQVARAVSEMRFRKRHIGSSHHA